MEQGLKHKISHHHDAVLKKKTKQNIHVYAVKNLVALQCDTQTHLSILLHWKTEKVINRL